MTVSIHTIVRLPDERQALQHELGAIYLVHFLDLDNAVKSVQIMGFSLKLILDLSIHRWLSWYVICQLRCCKKTSFLIS
jgi:hypothetical protein